MDKTWVIIPVYNEDASITSVVKFVRRQGFKNIIVVDDGSQNPANVSGAKVIRHTINRGKGAATKTGIQAALLLGADYVVTLDGDGQHDPKDLSKMLAPLHHGVVAVLGYRKFSPRHMPLFKILANHLANVLTGAISGLWVKDCMCGLKAYTARAARIIIRTCGDHYEYENEVVIQVSRHKLKFSQVPITTIYTRHSRTKTTQLNSIFALKTLYFLLVNQSSRVNSNRRRRRN